MLGLARPRPWPAALGAVPLVRCRRDPALEQLVDPDGHPHRRFLPAELRHGFDRPVHSDHEPGATATCSIRAGINGTPSRSASRAGTRVVGAGAPKNGTATPRS